MTEEDFRRYVALGREQRHVEFKGPGSRKDKAFLSTVMRAMLGMANNADGGWVIIGVDDDGTSLKPTGMTEADRDTWGFDDLASSVAVYAKPYVEFEVGPLCVDGAWFIWIEVQEFDSVPVLCGKSYPGKLRDGALYVRGRPRIETREIANHHEMRELVDRAVDKEMRAFVKRMVGAGLLTTPAPPAPDPSADQLYDDELGDFR